MGNMFFVVYLIIGVTVGARVYEKSGSIWEAILFGAAWFWVLADMLAEYVVRFQ